MGGPPLRAQVGQRTAEVAGVTKGIGQSGSLFHPDSCPGFVSLTMDVKGLAGPFVPNLASLCRCLWRKC